MTLGTNATLEELIKYSPQEIDFDFILAELKELEEWRELLGDDEYSVDDVKERLSEQEDSIAKKDREIERLKETIENLEDELDDANNEIERLKETIENLTPSD